MVVGDRKSWITFLLKLDFRAAEGLAPARSVERNFLLRQSSERKSENTNDLSSTARIKSPKC